MWNRLGWALLLLTAPSVAAQTETSVIKVAVPNVTVDVIVTDRKGHHIPGLTRERFSVLEDNVPQEIVSFTPPEIERDSGIRQPNPSDGNGVVVSPLPAPRGERVRRSITLLIDSGDLQPASLKDACAAAAQYVEKTVPAGNQISLYWVDSSLHLAVPFTDDKQRLLDALEKLSGKVANGRFTARDRIRTQQRIDDLFVTIHPETLIGATAVGSGRGGSTAGEQQEMNMLRSWLVISNTFQARAVFMALRALALGYRDLPGRKSVVVFSEGFLHAPDAGPQMQAVIDAANRAGVAFYVIDASGMGSPLSAEVRQPDIGGHRADPDPRIDGFGTTLGRDVFDWIDTLPSDVHSDLGNIAHATGGFLVSDTTQLLPALERVERDGGEFYTLVYHPLNGTYDGAFRKIKVTLDTGGYRLRYRQGFWAIPPGHEVMMTPAAAQLLAALEAGSRKAAFAPDLNAALVQTRDGGFAATVAASMPGTQVHFEKQKDRYSAGVTLLLVARDAQGSLVAIHERYGDLRFDKKQWAEFEENTFNVQGSVPLPSFDGLNVQAIVEFSNGAMGVSERVPLNVEPATEGPRLTSLVLSRRVESAQCGADLTDPLCFKNVRVYLPAHPRFLMSDKLTVCFVALNLTPDQQTKLPALRVSFDLIAGGLAAPITPERIQSVPGSTADSLVVLSEFSLKNFRAGKYVLRANAEDTVRHAPVKARAEFTVE